MNARLLRSPRLVGAGLLAVAGLASGGPAMAQDNAADRAEMDLAAGRALFQNSPLSQSIVEVRLPGAEPLGVPAPPPDTVTRPAAGRRAVRVILPSPYRQP